MSYYNLAASEVFLLNSSIRINTLNIQIEWKQIFKFFDKIKTFSF